MRVSRVYLAAPLASATVYTLPAATARYVTRVLRLKPGAPLMLFNGDGHEYPSEVQAVGRGRVQVRTGDAHVVDRESPLAVHLGLGISRGKRMDIALQKAVELGVSSVAPVITERSVVRLSDARAESRETHWQGVAVDACEQCGRTRLPAIEPLGTLAQWLEHHRGAALKLVLAPGAAGGVTSLTTPRGAVAVLIGPEGGLTPQELDGAAQAGFQPVALGPRVLRTETAAIAALTAVQVLWGDLA